MYDDLKDFYKKHWFSAGLTTLVFVAFIGLLFFRIMFVNFVDNYEQGYKFDLRIGQIERVDHTGYVVTWPFIVQVHTVDLRPMQVCINANSRVLNCKLVKFNPDGLELFLSWHGRSDYNNGGTSNFNQILMSYAYDGSGRTYPFLTVIRELKNEEQLSLEVLGRTNRTNSNTQPASAVDQQGLPSQDKSTDTVKP